MKQTNMNNILFFFFQALIPKRLALLFYPLNLSHKLASFLC